MLPQSLHIFRKDLRHLWPETLIGVILLAAFAWTAALKSTASIYAVYAGLLGGLLHVLIPIAWLVIVSRLIHDEPLVGDRQFWTSRPYHWAKLLAAKVLYLLVFIYLPFLLMQMFLLRFAGLHPLMALPALLYNLLLLTVIVIVPLAAIAAVTSTFARVLLSVLGAILYVLILAALAGYFSFGRMLPPHINGIATAVLILLPAVSLVYQYATRRTTISRLMLIAAPLLAVLLFFLMPTAALVRSAYPLAPTAGGPRLTPFAIPEHPITGSLRLLPGGYMQVALPFQVEGVEKDSDYIVRGTSVVVDAPGVHWSSPYVSSLLGPGQINATPFTILSAILPVAVFDKVHLAPADVHVSIALEHLKAGDASTWTAQAGGFDVPGHGHCTYAKDDSSLPPVCRFPFETPRFLYLTAPMAMDCSSSSPAGPKGSQDMGDHTATLDFDPVIQIPLQPAAGRQRGGSGVICPGTSISFVQGKPLGNARLEVDDKHLLLDPLAARNTPLPARNGEPAPVEPQ
jgi:hypothetical protein